LLPFLEKSIEEFVSGPIEDKVFCDLFAGTGAVGRYFKTKAKSIIANDLEYYSYVLNRNYIGNHKRIDASKWLKALAELQGEEGFIYANYCRGGHGDRNYFKDDNGKRIDAMRGQIEAWKDEEDIEDDVYFYLLATLLESADKVANTASVYGAYLKHIKKTASADLKIRPADFEITKARHQVYQGDANELVKTIKGDILYLDPPYNARQYGSNYHMLNTISTYENFRPKGVTGLPAYNRSAYCSKVSVRQSFEELVAHAQFKYVFLSYNNEGLMTHEEITSILEKYGKVELKVQAYQRFKADKTENRNHTATETMEYLFCLEKN
jgi:adenine-specific DNA-methyltransferase|tara:strand:- start:714 stop:1685 length:972 start_codon:yes stop_codon:yes gene_type:complete